MFFSFVFKILEQNNFLVLTFFNSINNVTVLYFCFFVLFYIWAIKFKKKIFKNNLKIINQKLQESLELL